MSAIYVLMLVGLVIAGSFLLVFLWAVKTGQFDDDVTPSIRILFDEEAPAQLKKVNPVEPVPPGRSSESAIEK